MIPRVPVKALLALAALWLPLLASSPLRADSGASPAPSGAGPVGANQFGANMQRDQRLKLVRLDQKLNSVVPVQAVFQDEDGHEVHLGDLLGKRPLMLMLIQFRCTMLCTEELSVLKASLNELKFTAGNEFDLAVVSIDPREKADLAAEMKASFLASYHRPGAAAGVHFLTGTKAEIDRLSDSIGFHYYYDRLTDQYAHPDGVIVVTPQGKVARYYFKLSYAPRDLRLGLVEASRERIGTLLDDFALLCFHYNPLTGKYAFAILSLARLCSIATVMGLALGIALMKTRERIVSHGRASQRGAVSQ